MTQPTGPISHIPTVLWLLALGFALGVLIALG